MRLIDPMTSVVVSCDKLHIAFEKMPCVLWPNGSVNTRPANSPILFGVNIPRATPARTDLKDEILSKIMNVMDDK